MYNNFSSKKTKKVISALLASALVVTSGPITADAATAKVVGIKKSITVSASATNKVTGLSKAEKKIVKVTKKGKKFTIKGLKAGKATFKIGKKSYTVKVGATTVKAAKTKLTLTKGKKATLKFTTKSGNGDTLTFKASNKNVTLAKTSAKIAKSAASVKATAKKAGKTTITATSKATGKKATVTVTVKNAAKPATTTPGASNTPVATATGSATNTPEATATATATATASGSATNTPDVTATPVATATGTATATPVATGSATNTPEATEVPTEAPTKAPEVVTGGTITVTGAAVSGATIVVTNASGAAVNTANRLPAGTYTVTVKKDGYDTKTVEVKLADKEDKVVTVELEESLAVASVKALNLKEVEVTFNQALTTAEATEAAKSTNYAVYKDGQTSATSVTHVTVSDDKKSVILLLTDVLEQNKEANKVVVKKAIGLAADKTVSNIKSEDVIVPQVAEVKAVGNQVIEITFTEAIKEKTANTMLSKGANGTNSVFTISQNGKAVDDLGFTAELSDNYRTVTLKTDTVLSSGNYEVSVADDTIVDYVGYKVPAGSKTVAVTSATTVAAPTKINVKSRTEVVIDFSGTVTDSTKAKLTWKTATGTKSVTGATAINGNKSLKFTFATTDVIPVGSVDFTLEDVVDAYGYEVPKKTFEKVDVVADSIATATVSVENDGEIDVIFSKAMQGTLNSTNSTTAGDANNKANFVLTDNSTGKAVDLTDVTATYKTSKEADGTLTYKVTLVKSGWALKGDYTLTVSGAKDSVGTEMTKLVETINVKDTTRPTIPSAAKYSEDSNKISITYSEVMATSGEYSILDGSNYKLNGTTKLSDAGATLTSADGKTVIITLPNTVTITPGTTTLKVGDIGTSIKTVADSSGNVLDDGTVNKNVYKTIAIDKESKPTILSKKIKVGGANTIYVEADNFVSAVAGDFEYTLDGKTYATPQNASLTTIENVEYIELTINDTISASTKIGNIKVRTKATGTLSSTSALGSNPDKGVVAGGVDAKDFPFQASIKSAEVLNATQVRVTFDGLVGKTGINTGTADFLESVLMIENGTTTYKTTGLTVVKDGESAVIVKVASLDNSKPVIVKTANYTELATGARATDANGKFYTQNTTGVTATVVSDKLVVNDVKLVEGTGNLDDDLNDGDKLQVNFNQSVDPKSIYNGDWTGSGDALSLTVKVVMGADGKMTLAPTSGTTAINFGTISGVDAPAGNMTSTATLAFTSGQDYKQMTLTFGRVATSTMPTGKLTYTPSSNIKTSLGTGITVDSKVTSLGAASDLVPAAADTTSFKKGASDKTAAYVAGDKITITLSKKVAVENITLDNVTVADGSGTAHTFGLGATIAPATANAKYDNKFVITLGTGHTVAAADVIKIAANKAVTEMGKANASALSYTGLPELAVTVSTKLVKAGTLSTQTVVFSKNLSEASKTAIKTAIDAKITATPGDGTATVTTSWIDDKKLAITVTTSDDGSVTVGALVAPITVIDAEGLETTLAVADLQANA